MSKPRIDWKTLDIKLRYLWKCGDTAPEIAETMGLTRQQVHHRANYLGLPRRYHRTLAPITKPYAKPRRADPENRA